MAKSSASLDKDINNKEVIKKWLPEGTSPSVFVYTLANIVAAEIAIKHKCKGELSFFIYEKKCMDLLSEYASSLINNDICDAVIFGWCELLKDEYNTELKLIKKI